MFDVTEKLCEADTDTDKVRFNKAAEWITWERNGIEAEIQQIRGMLAVERGLAPGDLLFLVSPAKRENETL